MLHVRWCLPATTRGGSKFLFTTSMAVNSVTQGLLYKHSTFETHQWGLEPSFAQSGAFWFLDKVTMFALLVDMVVGVFFLLRLRSLPTVRLLRNPHTRPRTAYTRSITYWFVPCICPGGSQLLFGSYSSVSMHALFLLVNLCCLKILFEVFFSQLAKADSHV